MNHRLDIVELHQLSGPQLQHRLLAELDKLFREIEDGTVKENTFTGCIAMGHKGLPPLDENQSKQIKEVLLATPVAVEQSAKGGIPILSTVLNLLWSLWGSHDTNDQPAQDGVKSHSSLLDEYGRVKSNDTAPTDDAKNSRIVSQEIQEEDVRHFLAAHGGGYNWMLPYAWDIANKLNAVKQSETDGDLGLFLERRRKLNVRRPRTTRFEQSLQRYAAAISELYCDENGDITDKKSLEAFISALVTALLDKTKAYWATSPLLAIFDGLVATVMRPLLHKHQTAYFQSETTTAAGVIVSGSMMGKKEELVTTPKWNATSHRLAVQYVKNAFKPHVWTFFLDWYAPYNWEYSKSPHLNAAALTNVGLLIKSFGDPVHLGKVMELLQPTSQADELVHYVVDHFRGSDFIGH